jgi:hypothetical protein
MSFPSCDSRFHSHTQFEVLRSLNRPSKPIPVHLHQLRHGRFFPNIKLFSRHSTTQRYTVWHTDNIVKWSTRK